MFSKLIMVAAGGMVAIAGLAAPAVAASTASPLTRGIDISSSFGKPSIATWKNTYLPKYKFVFVKATEGTYYTNPNFGGVNGQYCRAAMAGLLPGAYHFANPYDSGGKQQADDFFASLVSPSACRYQGKALPGVLDLEYDPYGHGYCWGLTPQQMVAWVRAFDAEYTTLMQGVHPIIYTPVNWWNTCTNSSSAFSKTNVFWLPEYNGSSTGGPTKLTPGTATWTFWQNGSTNAPPLDTDFFKGTLAELSQYAVPQSFSVGAHVDPGWTPTLGQPTSPEVAVTAFGATGYYQNFSGGRGLIASPDGSVYTASGSIYESWTPLSWGWPTDDPTPLAAQGINGYTQSFSEGSAGKSQAFWTPNYGTAWVDGKILTSYNAQGGPAGSWGWPTASIKKQSGFGVAGSSLALQSSRSVINSKYGLFLSDGGDRGAIFRSWSPARWGWPTAAPARASGRGINGYRQAFAEGASGVSEAFWTPNYGAAWVDGAALTTYRAVGGPAWGWPTSSMKKQTAFGTSGAFVAIQNGRSIISSKYGTFSGNGVDKGAVYASWSPARYGWPTTRLTAVNTHGIAGYQQKFAQSGTAQTRAFWSKRTPTPLWLGGAILSRYDALGGTPALGWPTAAATSRSAFGVQGSIQDFQSRALITSRYGTYSSNGLIFASWKPALRGWPTADLKSTVLKGRAGWLQTFRKGAKGLDYGFLAKRSHTVVWTNGKP